MNPFSATDLKRWVEENRHLYQPPYKTNRILAHYSEFFVLVLNGPNSRLDFHREPGEEFFFQIHGDIGLHVKPEGERRQVVRIREGEMFLCPGGVAHSPRRGEGAWGLVIERKRRAGDRAVPLVLRTMRSGSLGADRGPDPGYRRASHRDLRRVQRRSHFADLQGLRLCVSGGASCPEAPIPREGHAIVKGQGPRRAFRGLPPGGTLRAGTLEYAHRARRNHETDTGHDVGDELRCRGRIRHQRFRRRVRARRGDAEQDLPRHTREGRRDPADRAVQGVRQSLLCRAVLRVGVAVDHAAGPHPVRFRPRAVHRRRDREHREDRAPISGTSSTSS